MENIFVAIASYRDRECQWTLKNLFEAARFPERIAVGICWQFDPELDRECFSEPCPRPGQVQVIDVPLADARGACWAKAKALSLLGEQEYVLLIDSHMRFAEGWDVEMIEMLRQTGNPRAFLSTYPAGYVPPDERRFNTPRLVPVKFFERVMSMNSVLLDMPRPLPSYLMAGGYLFGHREMFVEVPYDPHIYFIGEEVTHAARYYTHGWDGHTPHKCLIHHYYERKEAPHHWDDDKERWPEINRRSYKRIRHVLGIERTADAEALLEIERYGIGQRRTLEQFQAAIGVNFKALLIDRKRQESIAAIEQHLARPQLPRADHEIDALGVHACRHGQFLLPGNDAYIGKAMTEYGEWTEGLLKLLAALFAPGAHVVEVGAGFGAHAIPLARLAGAEGRLTAIEQSQRMVDLLHANRVLNQVDNLHIVHAHAGPQTGAVEIDEPVFRTEGGNFGMIKHRPMADWQKMVPSLMLDGENWGPVDCLVIDTPGAVAEVLAGARRLLASQRPVLLVNADNAGDAERSGEILRQAGYHLWRHVCPFFVADNFFQCQENLFGGLASQSLIALPDGRDISALGALPQA